MKIVSWNANGAFRKKYRELSKLGADIYVVMECENPDTVDDPEYHAFVDNGVWVGRLKYKGLMVFSPDPNIRIERLDWGDEHHSFFIPVKINDKYTLVGAWACGLYCAELYDWINTVGENLTDEATIIGDLNSNVMFDGQRREIKGREFSDCLRVLKDKGIVGLWHFFKDEEHGKESVPTFFLYRHLDKSYHIDHALGSPKNVRSMKIHSRWEWLSLSDHLPIEIELVEKD